MDQPSAAAAAPPSSAVTPVLTSNDPMHLLAATSSAAESASTTAGSPSEAPAPQSASAEEAASEVLAASAHPVASAAAAPQAETEPFQAHSTPPLHTNISTASSSSPEKPPASILAASKSKKQIKPKSLNSLFLKVQASSSSPATHQPSTNAFASQPKLENPSVSKPSPVGSTYASLASSKATRSHHQITSMSTATGAFKLATTMRRETSPFQKSTTLSTSGSSGSPRSDVASTVWKRTADEVSAASPAATTTMSVTKQSNDTSASTLTTSTTTTTPASMPQATVKNVTFDDSVKDSKPQSSTPSQTSTTTTTADDDDDISEEELLRRGIYLTRRLSADAPRREFNWDEDDDISWDEIAKSTFLDFTDKPTSSAAISAGPSKDSSSSAKPTTDSVLSSPQKKYEPPHKSSTTSGTWKVPQISSNFVPISKQIQELSEQKQQQQQHNQRYWNSGSGHGQNYNDNDGPRVDNRYRFSDYERRYRPENPSSSKPELFNEHSGQIETFVHRHRGSSSNPRTGGGPGGRRGSENVLDTYERRHSGFHDDALPDRHRGGSPVRRYHTPHHEPNQARFYRSETLERQEDAMRLARENAIKRREEENRLEREREEATRRKAAERLAKLEAKLQLEREEKQRLEEQEKSQAEQQQHQQQKSLVQPESHGSNNLNVEDNAAIRAVNSLIEEDIATTTTNNNDRMRTWANDSNGTAGGTAASSTVINSPNSTATLSQAPYQDREHNPPSSGSADGPNNFWMPMHGPRASEGHQVWGSSAFPANHHQNIYPKQNPTSTPTAAGSAATGPHMLPAWGNIASSEHHSFDHSQQFMTDGSSSSSTSTLVPEPKWNNKSVPSQQATQDQQHPQQQSQRQQHPQQRSSSKQPNQRSASLPSSPMASMHPQPQQQSVSESSSNNSSTSKLVSRSSGLHEPPSMARGFSRFFPTSGIDDIYPQQHSPVESLASIASPGSFPQVAAASSSPIASDVSSANGMLSSYQSVTPPRSIHGGNVGLNSSSGGPHAVPFIPSGTGPVTPNGGTGIPPPSAFFPGGGPGPGLLSAHVPEMVVTSGNASAEELSYLAEIGFPHGFGYSSVAASAAAAAAAAAAASSAENGGPHTIANNVSATLPYMPNIVIPPPSHHMRAPSFSNTLEETLFADIVRTVVNPRISLPPSRARQDLSSQFKTTPSINSIQALQSTIAEKLSNTGSLRSNNTLASRSTNSAGHHHHQQQQSEQHLQPQPQHHTRAAFSKDLPFPVSPIILSENIPPFNSLDPKRTSVIQTVFTPQATNQEEIYTPVMRSTSLNNNTVSTDTNTSNTTTTPSEPTSFIVQSPVKPQYLSNNQSTADHEMTDENDGEQFEGIRIQINHEYANDESLGTELNPQSRFGVFEDQFREYIDELDQSQGSKVPIAMPYYTSSAYNPALADTAENKCEIPPEDWDKGLVVPRDRFLCTLFFWSENQATAFNREFKPRINSRVSLLIPGNTTKILTQYRVGATPSTYTNTSATSLDELIENQAAVAAAATAAAAAAVTAETASKSASSAQSSTSSSSSGRSKASSKRSHHGNHSTGSPGLSESASSSSRESTFSSSQSTGPKLRSKRSASTSLSGPLGRGPRRLSSNNNRNSGNGSNGGRMSSGRDHRSSASTSSSTLTSTKVKA